MGRVKLGRVDQRRFFGRAFAKPDDPSPPAAANGRLASRRWRAYHAVMRLVAVLALLVAAGCGDQKAKCANARKEARAALAELAKTLPTDGDEKVGEYDENPDDGPAFMAPVSNDGTTAKFQFHGKLPAKASDVKEGSPEYLRYVELGVKARDICKK
jgi:hypothetical protein